MDSRPGGTIHLRRATVEDVEALARGVIEGVEDYPSFAPAGWTAPSPEAEADHLRGSLADERVWCLVAESDGELAVDGALGRGFEELRLFVAAGQARARRFYEREGWLAAGDEFDDPVPGLTMVEYRFRAPG